MTDQELEELIQRTLRNATIVLIFSILAILVSLVADIYEIGKDQYFWLQRSGAIAVVFSATVEFWFSKIRHDIVPPSSSYVADDRWGARYGTGFNVLSVVAICLLVCGTFIWGYGDLPFKNS